MVFEIVFFRFYQLSEDETIQGWVDAMLEQHTDENEAVLLQLFEAVEPAAAIVAYAIKVTVYHHSIILYFYHHRSVLLLKLLKTDHQLPLFCKHAFLRLCLNTLFLCRLVW